MKTWIFGKSQLDESLVKWVDRQKATGHPKAIANADFVADAIRDFLETSKELSKSLSEEGREEQISVTPSKSKISKTRQEDSHEPKLHNTDPSQTESPQKELEKPIPDRNTDPDVKETISNLLEEWKRM